MADSRSDAVEVPHESLGCRKAGSGEPYFPGNQLTWLMRLLFIWITTSSVGLALASVPDTHAAASLHAKYASLGERLHHNQFQRALYLDSSESSNDLNGSIYAVVDYPFSTVRAALDDPGEWCEVLILHTNTKYCHATTEPSNTVLTVSIGKKTVQALEDAYPIDFSYRVTAATPQFLEIRLNAAEGPLTTSNYRIHLQAVPIENGRTFLHLTYSYAYGFIGRVAMETYLATLGRNKVGFTVTGMRSNGQPEYIGGMRGVAERNTMRYYLAIDAYLGAFDKPPDLRLQERLQSWFTATEQYQRQLHELGRADYMAMKQMEYLRQQTAR